MLFRWRVKILFNLKNALREFGNCKGFIGCFSHNLCDVFTDFSFKELIFATVHKVSRIIKGYITFLLSKLNSTF